MSIQEACCMHCMVNSWNFLDIKVAVGGVCCLELQEVKYNSLVQALYGLQREQLLDSGLYACSSLLAEA